MVRTSASDVHIERHRTSAGLRYRLDGVLVQVKSDSFLFDEYAAVVTRIRILASLDIAERRLPQDGRFSYTCEHGAVDVRVSVLHAVSGERIVLRILSASSGGSNFESLGMALRQATIFEQAGHASQGMVLVPGPTGSGKTTTLYTMLNLINTDQVNILAVEDPVECRLDGVGQVQVQDQPGLGFADTLRAFLRQDPEVILVGEIRDGETADIAFKAALTGHLVLSTLHTRDSATTIARLVNIGLSPYMVGSALSLVVAQRLVRVLCTQCKTEDDTSAELIKSLGFESREGAGAVLFRGNGCEHCAWTGYHGRRGVFEMLKVDGRVRNAIRSEVSIDEIAALCAGQGSMSLAQSLSHLLLTGVIDLAEYQRNF